MILFLHFQLSKGSREPCHNRCMYFQIAWSEYLSEESSPLSTPLKLLSCVFVTNLRFLNISLHLCCTYTVYVILVYRRCVAIVCSEKVLGHSVLLSMNVPAGLLGI